MSWKEFRIWLQAKAPVIIRNSCWVLVFVVFCRCAVKNTGLYRNGVINYETVEINSLDYTPLRAAEAACGSAIHGGWRPNQLEEVTDGTRTVFYTQATRGVEYEGVIAYVEAMATESGIVMTNREDFPSSEIAEHYFGLANFRKMYYIVVEMEPEPSSQPLTPARVSCQKWHN